MAELPLRGKFYKDRKSSATYNTTGYNEEMKIVKAWLCTNEDGDHPKVMTPIDMPLKVWSRTTELIGDAGVYYKQFPPSEENQKLGEEVFQRKQKEAKEAAALRMQKDQTLREMEAARLQAEENIAKRKRQEAAKAKRTERRESMTKRPATKTAVRRRSRRRA